MEISAIGEKILPCNMNKPFAFVSYKSEDSIYVWDNVYELQKRGYNLWIDIGLNLNPNDKSWEKALKVIEDINCALIMFFLSKDSVKSKYCLKELRKSEDPETMITHNGKKIPILIIETEKIGKINDFRNMIFEMIRNDQKLSNNNAEKNEQSKTLYSVIEEFIPSDDILRILSKDSDTRRTDFYSDIETILQFNGIAPFGRNELYCQGVHFLQHQAEYLAGIKYLQMGINDDVNFVPSYIIMAFIKMYNLYGQSDLIQAKEYLDWAEFLEPSNHWFDNGMVLKKCGRVEEAVAYLMASSIKTNNPAGYLEAAKIWIKLGNQVFACKCAEAAYKLGSRKGHEIFIALSRINTLEFDKASKKVIW